MEKKNIVVSLLFISVVAAYLLVGHFSGPECALPRDCEGLAHDDCITDWMCVDNSCVWDCGKQTTTTIPSAEDPQSAYCVDMGYDLKTELDMEGNEVNMCVFPGGLSCTAQSYYLGECIVFDVGSCDLALNMSYKSNVSHSTGLDHISIRQNLSYVCCANLTVSLNRSGRLLEIYEENVGEFCRCICGYEVEMTVPGLESGVYEVRIYGVEYQETKPDLLSSFSAQVGSECDKDSECVPGECCHPTYCVPLSDAPNCSDAICTEECMGGTMDCGAGTCVCLDGACMVAYKTPE